MQRCTRCEIKVVILIITVLTLAIFCLLTFISYGVTGTATGSTSNNRYLTLDWKYVQDKTDNTVTCSVTSLKCHNTKADGLWSGTVKTSLIYGLYGAEPGTDRREYGPKSAAAKGGTEVGFRYLLTLNGWDGGVLKTAVVKQTYGKPVKLTFFAKYDMTAVGLGTHTVSKYIDVSGYNGGSKTVSGIVTWNDNNNKDGKRPSSITATIKRIPSNTVNGASTYSYSKGITSGSWSGNYYSYGYGATYSYTISYPEVEGYTKTISGNNVTYTQSTSEVTFDGNGGSVPIAKLSLRNGTSDYYGIGHNLATRPGYIFNGYYTESSGGDKVYDSNGIAVSGEFWTENGASAKWKGVSSVTLYAQWTAIPAGQNNYHILFGL